jgi:hypothetical protein
VKKIEEMALVTLDSLMHSTAIKRNVIFIHELCCPTYKILTIEIARKDMLLRAELSWSYKIP